jgi:cellobiose phosphorylase
MPLPCLRRSLFLTRHGFGYSVFEHSEDGIQTEAWIYVDIEATVKFTVLRVRNLSGRARRLSVTGYVEWVLGDLRSKNLMHIVTELDISSGSIVARNPYNTEFGSRLAFFDTDESMRTITTDREEFIGRNGNLRNPDALNRARLSGKTGAGLDPCAAIQVPFGLDDHEEKEIIFRLGSGKDYKEATELIRQFRGSAVAREALEKVRNFWKNTLSTVQIDTPDPALNILTNGWLNYQTLSCRIWGRSGFYQSGGAFGFRDQLQDVLSLLHNQPQLAREQILRCASRQFREGDVQHWWHPPSGRGVRTRCSDDYLWLPYVTARYIQTTGDLAILSESVHFLEGRSLNQDEDSYYDLPIRSNQSASVYDHCLRALEHGFRYGEHGLPLMGSGDWNDGMDKVGILGKGESVWLAFFLYDILMLFIEVAEARRDSGFAQRCRSQADELARNIERHAWDGNWFLRAYFDDGTPLGSASNPECQIDSIAQSWSVLSRAAEPRKARIAIMSAERRLVIRERGIIQLFDPPFDKSSLNPGYIKGYAPGVRENGGQYTHGAIWMIMAFAFLKDHKRTWELLQMINPIHHANNPEQVARYRVEPYVIAADVYGIAKQSGRGGWTWYTGSAGWMYQLVLQSFLGIHREKDRLCFDPCLPAEWASTAVHYRYQESVYHILTERGSAFGSAALRVRLDGAEQPDHYVLLINDGREHQVVLELPA